MHSDWGEIAQGCGSHVQCFLHNNIRQIKRVWPGIKAQLSWSPPAILVGQYNAPPEAVLFSKGMVSGRTIF